MVFDRIRNWYRTYRYGGVTGLNYVSANAKMTSVIALPWLGGYLFCFMFVPDPFLEGSILLESALWIAYVYGVYAYAKVDATKYKPFPQSQWRFPDGGTRKYDLLIPPNGFSKECDFKDGTTGWRVNLGKRLQYQDRRMDFPIVFDYALLRLPAKKPDECFSWLSEGEFFHKGLAIKDPSCEDTSIYVHGYVQDKEGQYVPVGEIFDCSWRYEQALKNALSTNPREMSRAHRFELAYRNERSRRMLEEKHSATLEAMVEIGQKDSVDIRGRVEDEITKRRNLFKTIVDMGKPLVTRIKENFWKIVGVFLIIFVVLWLLGVIKI